MNTLEKAFELTRYLLNMTDRVFFTVDDVMNKATPAEIDFYYAKICKPGR